MHIPLLMWRLPGAGSSQILAITPEATQDSLRISRLKSDPVDEGSQDVLDKNLWSQAL